MKKHHNIRKYDNKNTKTILFNIQIKYDFLKKQIYVHILKKRMPNE